MCILDREGSRVFASRALVAVVQMVVYLTGYGDCLTGFREPLSPHHRCRTGLKNILMRSLLVLCYCAVACEESMTGTQWLLFFCIEY